MPRDARERAGPLTGVVTRLRSSKKRTGTDLFFFRQDNLNLKTAIGLCDRAPERSLCCTRNFAIMIFFLTDAAFSKLVAGRTRRAIVPGNTGYVTISAYFSLGLPSDWGWSPLCSTPSTLEARKAWSDDVPIIANYPLALLWIPFTLLRRRPCHDG